MKRLLLLSAVLMQLWVPCVLRGSNIISKSFEFRYYSSSLKANGETDFKGSTELFNTDQRVDFLHAYADYAANYFNDPDLNHKAVEKNEIQKVITTLKPQPLTEIRRTMCLTQWKALGYRDGKIAAERESIKCWIDHQDVSIIDGHLQLEQGRIEHKFDKEMAWRFNLRWKVSLAANSKVSFKLSTIDGCVMETGYNPDGRLYCRHGSSTTILQQYTPGVYVEFNVEVDLENDVFNLYLDGERVLYGVDLMRKGTAGVNTFAISTSGKVNIDDIFGVDFVRQSENVRIPFAPRVAIDQDFNIRPEISGWERLSYDDTKWREVTLPAVHGGIRYEGEDFYLRTVVKTAAYKKAVLSFETLDPGGDIFINGHQVASITDRRSVRVDVTKYLKPNVDNLIAVKVNSFLLENPMHHTCADRHIGWFAGRCKLELSAATTLKMVLANTEKLDGVKATQHHRVIFENSSDKKFTGEIEIRYSPWFPETGNVCSVRQFDVEIESGKTVENSFRTYLDNALLWTAVNPNLYKVQILLKNSQGQIVDDYILTTGVRTISQAGGIFKVNGKEEMLNGTQIMGYRMPVENLARYNRCAPFEILVQEMLMAVNCGCNMVRIHVHAAMNTADGIQDPRIPELCDQLGLMLVWAGGAWIREGQWEAIDFDGLESYIQQLYNHPSIVVWELSNHPNRFKGKPVRNSFDFVERTMKCALAVDKSRLISPTTFWQHTNIANDAGTKDKKGNVITVPAEYTHPLCTRGTQDAITGYGAAWSVLRQWPSGWTQDCLDNKQRAFFNWEHEESIAQPNWNLSKGKPWHQLHSYEWGYDKGSIGRKLQTSEWRASQAFQALSAYESMKKQRMHGVAGFSWCCLHGGANSGTYKKPIIDSLGYSKLAWYIHKLVYQRVLAGSDNVDVVYGPDDLITPVIMNLDYAKVVSLRVVVKSIDGKIIKDHIYKNIDLKEGGCVKKLKPLKVPFPADGYYIVEYIVEKLFG